MSTIMQKESARSSQRDGRYLIETLFHEREREEYKSTSANTAINGGESQTASAQDDYDERVLLIRKAFSEISKLCYWTDYKLDPDDWALLDAARLDNLPYNELRAALRYAYKQIKRKAQARARSVEIANDS